MDTLVITAGDVTLEMLHFEFIKSTDPGVYKNLEHFYSDSHFL